LLLILGVSVPHTLRLLRRLLLRILLGLPLLLVLCLLSSYALDAGFGSEVNTLVTTWVGAVGLVLRARREQWDSIRLSHIHNVHTHLGTILSGSPGFSKQ
jgi:predicted membrane metal-binding protein